VKRFPILVYFILCANKNIIKVVCKEMEWEGLDLFKLDRDRRKFWKVVNMGMSV